MNQIEYMKKTFDFIDKALGLEPLKPTPKREKCDACGKELEAGQDLCEKCKVEVEQGWEEWEIEKAKELLEKNGYEVKKAGLTGLAGLAEIVGRISATADKFEELLKEKEAGDGEEKPNS